MDYNSTPGTLFHVIGGIIVPTLYLLHWSLSCIFFSAIALYQIYDGCEDILAKYHTKWDMLEVGVGVMFGTWIMIAINFIWGL